MNKLNKSGHIASNRVSQFLMIPESFHYTKFPILFKKPSTFTIIILPFCLLLTLDTATHLKFWQFYLQDSLPEIGWGSWIRIKKGKIDFLLGIIPYQSDYSLSLIFKKKKFSLLPVTLIFLICQLQASYIKSGCSSKKVIEQGPRISKSFTRFFSVFLKKISMVFIRV